MINHYSRQNLAAWTILANLDYNSRVLKVKVWFGWEHRDISAPGYSTLKIDNTVRGVLVQQRSDQHAITSHRTNAALPDTETLSKVQECSARKVQAPTSGNRKVTALKSDPYVSVLSTVDL
jgi:hypothetical protein